MTANGLRMTAREGFSAASITGKVAFPIFYCPTPRQGSLEVK